MDVQTVHLEPDIVNTYSYAAMLDVYSTYVSIWQCASSSCHSWMFLDASVCHLSNIQLHLSCYAVGFPFWYSREIYRSKLCYLPKLRSCLSLSSELGRLLNISPTPLPDAYLQAAMLMLCEPLGCFEP